MIYLGPLYEKREEQRLLEQTSGGLSNASNTFQYNLLNGFLENKIESLTVINVLPVGIWPKNCQILRLQHRAWSLGGHRCLELGSLNLPVFKQFQREKATKRVVEQLVREDKEVLIYSTYLPFLRAVRKLDPSVKVTLIVTDLPEYYDLGRTSRLKKLLRRLNNRLIDRAMERVDRFVLLTEEMRGPLHVGERPYIVVEGITASSDLPAAVRKDPAVDKIIFYAGSLHRQFGLPTLLEAFEQLERKDVQLWLCGGGDAEEEIRQLAERDPRVRFYGYVSSDRVAELRAQADILVNPRPNEGEYTKYSFPSKTMEYMLSGKPVVMYPLAGMPPEYAPHVHLVQESGARGLCRVLSSVLDERPEERAEFGQLAARFVAEQKNPKVQAGKILELLERQVRQK